VEGVTNSNGPVPLFANTDPFVTPVLIKSPENFKFPVLEVDDIYTFY